MAGQTAPVSGCWSYFRWVPLISPAVKEGFCEVDHSLIQSRIGKVGLAAIALLVAAFVIASACPAASFLIPLPTLLLFLIPLDSWIAERAANVKAVNEYLDMNYPSRGATFRIQHNLGAARLLVSRNGNLNKLNEEGNHLLGYIPDLNVFKHLVDHGINLKGIDRYGTPFFQQIVEESNPAFLEYVLTQNKVAAADFTPAQQVGLWLHLGNLKAGPMLARHGFDVNVRGDRGFTPLLTLVKDIPGRFGFTVGHKLGPAMHAKTLLESGADKSLTVEDGGQKNALQISTNPAVREVLEQN